MFPHTPLASGIQLAVEHRHETKRLLLLLLQLLLLTPPTSWGHLLYLATTDTSKTQATYKALP